MAYDSAEPTITWNPLTHDHKLQLGLPVSYGFQDFGEFEEKVKTIEGL